MRAAAGAALGALVRLVLLLHLLPTMVAFYWFGLGTVPTMPVWWLLGQSDLDLVRDVGVALMLGGSCIIPALLALWLRRESAEDLRLIAAESWFGRCFVRAVPLSGAIYVPLVALAFAVEAMPDHFDLGADGDAAVFWAVGGTLLRGLTFDLSSLVLAEAPGLRGLTREANAIVVLANAAITVVAVKAFLELLVETRSPLIPPRSVIARWVATDEFDGLIHHLYLWFRVAWLAVVVLSGFVFWPVLADRWA